VKREVILRDLPIDRRVFFKPVLPVGVKAQPADVKFFGFIQVEDADQGNAFLKYSANNVFLYWRR
jgi:hypothetical protein